MCPARVARLRANASLPEVPAPLSSIETHKLIANLLLLCDFESDIEFYRHPKGKAGNADYQPNRCFLNAKDISKQVRDSVRDPGLVEEIPRGCHEYSDPDDASHSI